MPPPDSPRRIASIPTPDAMPQLDPSSPEPPISRRNSMNSTLEAASGHRHHASIRSGVEPALPRAATKGVVVGGVSLPDAAGTHGLGRALRGRVPSPDRRQTLRGRVPLQTPPGHRLHTARQGFAPGPPPGYTAPRCAARGFAAAVRARGPGGRAGRRPTCVRALPGPAPGAGCPRPGVWGARGSGRSVPGRRR